MSLAKALDGVGTGALTEESLSRRVYPLFSKSLGISGIYLANHSLGRPLDQTEEDLCEGFRLWQSKLGDAWEWWLEEQEAHRSRLARLIGAPRSDCIVPKASAGQGLRTILNSLPGVPRVVSSTGEFDSIDVILKQYAALGRITLHQAPCESADGGLDLTLLIERIRRGADLVILSQVMFMTGRIVPELDRLAELCHEFGARLAVDAYHSAGVFPIDVSAMKADFLIGGSYKYLRGGPGAAFLYISPDAVAGLRPFDIGWFAKEDPFRYTREERPRLAAGGNAFLESTPPVLTYYQARAGQQLALGLGIDRIRAYSLDLLGRLKSYLEQAEVPAKGADNDHGAFLTVEDAQASLLVTALERVRVTTDSRGRWLRMSPDYLTRDEDLRAAASLLGAIWRDRRREQ
ncbi:MAG: aminotransferase class V-fold PLP-dependent enzyme [Bryobacteraceae bacterium]|jgi:kynureninase